MNKQRILFLLFAAAFIVALLGASFFRQMAQQKRYITTIFTYGVGKELIESTNSSFLVTISPELHAQLSQLLASTTHIASVRLGDEPAPVGDGRATSRLVLTNALAHGLGIRLRLGSDGTGKNRFNVLGYWTFSKPGDAADGNQPFNSVTNRTSEAPAANRSP